MHVYAGTRPASYSSASLSSTAELHGVLLLSDIYGWQSKQMRYVSQSDVSDFTVTLSHAEPFGLAQKTDIQ
jgi:hypothetical protein